MNKTIKKLVLMALIVPFFFTSCSSDDSNPPTPTPTPTPPESRGAYENGVFVLNEGNGNLSTASITFISNNGLLTQDVFRTENPNAEEIGTYLQNIFFDENNAYIISGQADVVTIVNRYTFKYVATVSENLTNPRYGVVSEGKAFVTNSGNFSATGGFVTVIDLSDYSTQKIELNTTAERIIEKDGKVYVSNGYFGDGNTITIIDAKTTNVDTAIALGTGNVPSNLDQKDGFLYVTTTKSVTDESWITTYSDPMILKVDMSNNEVFPKTLDESIKNPKNLTIENDVIYFTSSTSVYSLPLSDFDNDNVEPNKVFDYTSTSQWGAMYGFAVGNGRIYVADAPDFSSDGEVQVYSLSGDLQSKHPVGVGPNGFYFND